MPMHLLAQRLFGKSSWGDVYVRYQSTSLLSCFNRCYYRAKPVFLRRGMAGINLFKQALLAPQDRPDTGGDQLCAFCSFAVVSVAYFEIIHPDCEIFDAQIVFYSKTSPRLIYDFNAPAGV